MSTKKKSIKLFFKKDTVYQINISPDDRHQFLGKIDRYTKFHNFVYEQLLTWRYDYILHIEISEPLTVDQGKAGPRLHLHGTIKFEDDRQIFNFLSQDIYKLSRWGRTQFDTIKDLDHWMKYITKQSHIMPENSCLSRKTKVRYRPKVKTKNILSKLKA